MKRMLITGLCMASIIASASALAEDCGCLSAINGMQLNPPLKEAFNHVGTGITIAQNNFIVAEPAKKIGDNKYVVGLDHVCGDQNDMTMIIKQKIVGDKQITHITALPKHEHVNLVYTVDSFLDGVALNVIDIKKD